MRSEVGLAIDEVRAEIAAVAVEIMPDTCRLKVDEEIYPDTPCRLKSNGGNLDGAPYRIRLPWGSPAAIGATAIIDAISGRPQLTLQLVEPVDSSTGVWQDWQATAGPGFGRVDVGL